MIDATRQLVGLSRKQICEMLGTPYREEIPEWKPDENAYSSMHGDNMTVLVGRLKAAETVVVQLRKLGVPSRVMAVALGVSQESIDRRLRKHGVTPGRVGRPCKVAEPASCLNIAWCRRPDKPDLKAAKNKRLSVGNGDKQAELNAPRT